MYQYIVTHRRLVAVVGLIVLVPVVLIAWWLLSPLFIDKEVQEEFPFAASAVVPPDMTRSEIEKAMAVMAMMDDESMEEMPDEMMEAKDGGGDESGPVRVKTGSFEDADAFHKGSGRATIFRGPGGGHLLRLEDFKVTNGPDLRVILSPAADPGSRDEVSASGYVELGKLKGNIGSQNYPIPDDVDVAAQGSVVIYCRPFHVIFSVATLREVP
jgi:hypothetical protein